MLQGVEKWCMSDMLQEEVQTPYAPGLAKQETVVTRLSLQTLHPAPHPLAMPLGTTPALQSTSTTTCLVTSSQAQPHWRRTMTLTQMTRWTLASLLWIHLIKFCPPHLVTRLTLGSTYTFQILFYWTTFPTCLVLLQCLRVAHLPLEHLWKAPTVLRVLLMYWQMLSNCSVLA
jgi:hypothetical protein